MKKIVLLSSDTLHHRYFINKLNSFGHKFHSVLFETQGVKAPFETGPFYAEEEYQFEKQNFFKDVEHDISNEEIYEFENINRAGSINKLKEIQPDFGVVFGTRKLSDQLISLFPDGLVNVHRGIAQKYRGLDSDLWAVYHSDIKNIGVTLHMVESLLDTGGIVYQDQTAIPKGTKLFHLRYLTTLTATWLCHKVLTDYEKGALRSTPQQEKGRYYSFMPLVIKQTLVKKFDKLINGK